MRNSLLYYFIKEEIRLHMSLTKSRNYFSYPFMLMIFFTGITIFSSLFFNSFNTVKIAIFSINILFIGGIMSGTFGLYARDFLERKFGDVGRLFQNALILPIKLSKVFLSMAISDIFFYFFWFILPIMLGYGIGLAFIGESVLEVIFLCVASFFSFMSGLLLAFIFSVIYERSRTFFSLICVGLLGFVVYFIYNFEILNWSPFHLFYFEKELIYLFLMTFIVLILLFFAYFSVGREYKTTIRKSSKTKSSSFRSRFFDRYLIKDFIDMKRTGDLFAKPFFNVFLPSVLVLLMFANSNEFALYNMGTIFFAIILGTLGTQMLNSLINSDSLAYYRHLPVTLRDFIKPKIKLSLFICFIQSVIILGIYAYYIRDFQNVLYALIVALALLVYNFNLSFFLTGLNPNENLMHSKTFLVYFALLVPVLILIVVINILFSFALIYFLLFLVFCLVLGKLYFELGLRRWDRRE